MTIEEARAKRYDVSGINPRGFLYREGYCAESVSDFTGFHYYQCSRKNGKGENGLYCGIHAKRHPAKEK